MQAWLARKCHKIHPVMPAYLFVFWYAIRIGCKNEVELLRRIYKDFEIWGVFFVPEHSYESVFSAVLYQVAQRIDVSALVVGEQVAPFAVVSRPGRFY